jgi:hypothetical protein
MGQEGGAYARQAKPVPCEVGMQIPCGDHTEVPRGSLLRKAATSFEESPCRGVLGLRRRSSGWRVGADKGRARAHWQAVVHAFFRRLIPGGPRNARICLSTAHSN